METYLEILQIIRKKLLWFIKCTFRFVYNIHKYKFIIYYIHRGNYVTILRSLIIGVGPRVGLKKFENLANWHQVTDKWWLYAVSISFFILYNLFVWRNINYNVWFIVIEIRLVSHSSDRLFILLHMTPINIQFIFKLLIFLITRHNSYTLLYDKKQNVQWTWRVKHLRLSRIYYVLSMIIINSSYKNYIGILHVWAYTGLRFFQHGYRSH